MRRVWHDLQLRAINYERSVSGETMELFKDRERKDEWTEFSRECFKHFSVSKSLCLTQWSSTCVVMNFSCFANDETYKDKSLMTIWTGEYISFDRKEKLIVMQAARNVRSLSARSKLVWVNFEWDFFVAPRMFFWRYETKSKHRIGISYISEDFTRDDA